MLPTTPKPEKGLPRGESDFYNPAMGDKENDPDADAGKGESKEPSPSPGAERIEKRESFPTRIQKFNQQAPPKKASVSLRRSKQFALVTPATKTRIDLGITIKGKAPEGRLEASKNAMCTHVVKLGAIDDFDADVKAWLLEAYSAD